MMAVQTIGKVMALTVVEYSEPQITGHRKNVNKLFCPLDHQPYMLRSIKAACQFTVIILVKLFSIRYLQHQVILDSIDEKFCEFYRQSPIFYSKSIGVENGDTDI